MWFWVVRLLGNVYSGNCGHGCGNGSIQAGILSGGSVLISGSCGDSIIVGVVAIWQDGMVTKVVG